MRRLIQKHAREWKLVFALMFFAVMIASCGRNDLDRAPEGARWGTDEVPGELPEPRPELESLRITPDKIEVPIDASRNVTVEARFIDGSTQDVTEEARWSIQDESIASLDGTRVTAKQPGQTLLVAEYGGERATTPIIVMDARIEVIRVAPEEVQIQVDGRTNLTAWGTYDTGVEVEITDQVTWGAQDESIAVVSNDAGAEGEAIGLAPGRTEVIARLGELEGRGQLAVNDGAQLVQLAVSPPVSELLIGAVQGFSVIGIYTNGTNTDVSNQVSWSVEEPMIASITPDGILTARAPGVTTIKAEYSGLEATALVNVSGARVTSIDLFPSVASGGVGAQQQYIATATLDDGGVADITDFARWETSDAAIASVDQDGLVRARAPGAVTISTSLQGVEATARYTVTNSPLVALQIEPFAPVLAPAVREQFRAIARYADGTTSEVTVESDWTSSNEEVARIDERGILLAREPGTTVVAAVLGSSRAVASVTVTDALLTRIDVDPNQLVLGPGQGYFLEAWGTYADGSYIDLTESVTWTSSASAVAVSNLGGERGRLWAVELGGATITAALGMAVGQANVVVNDVRLTEIELTPEAVTMPVGTTTRFEALGKYADGTERDLTELVNWSSDAPLIVSARNERGREGEVVAVNPGDAMVIAELDGVLASAPVTVTDSALVEIQIEPDAPVVRLGQSIALDAVGIFADGTEASLTDVATWSSTDQSIGIVTNGERRGVVYGVAGGDVIIRARAFGMTGEVTVNVEGAELNRIVLTPRESTSRIGEPRQFTLQAIYEDATSQNVTAQASWSTSDPAIATIDAFGVATPRGPGQVDVIASFGGLTAQAPLVVNDAQLVEIQVSPSTPVVAKDTLMRFWATAIYSDGTHEDVSETVDWLTSDRSVMSITIHPRWAGIATAEGAGMAEISARYQGITGSTRVTVTDANLLEIKVTPTGLKVAPGTRLQYFAQAIFDDGTSQDVTFLSNWTTPDGDVADVFLEWWDRGTVVARREGVAEIRATYQGVRGSATLEVSAASISSIQVIPFSPTVNQGDLIRFFATAVYNDGTTQQISTEALWQSQDPNIATVANSMWYEGVVTAQAPGTTEILATYLGVTGRTDITVTGLQIDQIQVTPFLETIPNGYYLRMLATAIYSNGTSRDITGLATWTATDPQIVDVYASFWVKGWSLGLSPGTGFIQASYQGVTGQAKVTVTDATLTEIILTPDAAMVAPGETVELEAEGVFSDGSRREVTHYVTWSSTDQMVGDVSNAWISRGEATGFAPGVTTIKATQGTISGEATLTVLP